MLKNIKVWIKGNKPAPSLEIPAILESDMLDLKRYIIDRINPQILKLQTDVQKLKYDLEYAPTAEIPEREGILTQLAELRVRIENLESDIK